MNKSQNSSQTKTKTFVIGSSSPLCKAIDDDVRSGESYFFGRSNPYNFSNWIQTNGFESEASIKKLENILTEKMITELGIDTSSVNLIFVSGISSHDWQESFLVNELLPGILSVAFINSINNNVKWAESASITLIGSTGAYKGAKMPYSATKASLTGIMHTLNRSYATITRTNLIIPTAFNGGMIADWSQEKIDDVANTNIIGRLGDVEEIADSILFATSNRFVADSVINMSAGQVNIE